jgi:hypothetical protein
MSAEVTRVDGSDGWRVFEWDNGAVHRYMWEQELLDMRCHYCKSPAEVYHAPERLTKSSRRPKGLSKNGIGESANPESR